MTEEAVREYLSKLGRRGADATNNQLTPAERKKNAIKAAKTRWAKHWTGKLDKLEAKNRAARKKKARSKSDAVAKNG